MKMSPPPEKRPLSFGECGEADGSRRGLVRGQVFEAPSHAAIEPTPVTE